ncbi:MAG: glycosyltransferase involved in cell wall biosynthesis, partial [Flavobacteriales bacterium]
NSTLATTILQGAAGKRILILANLRSQKNHFLLIQLAIRIKISHPDWTFHLVGKDFKDDYATQIKHAIIDNHLKETVFIYDSKHDVENILSQSTIGVLTSASEGLPLALIEYGMAKVPVVVTNVGEIPLIISNGVNGYIVPVEEQLFYEKLVILMEDERKQAIFAERLFKTMLEKFGENSIIQSYLNWITEHCK